MKTIFRTLLIFLVPLSLVGQPWPQESSEWYYEGTKDVVEPGSYKVYPVYFTVEGDTILNGKKAMDISEGGCVTGGGILYMENRVIYQWDPVRSLFDTIYDINTSVGDTFNSFCLPMDDSSRTFQMKVDSVQFFNINGQNKKGIFATELDLNDPYACLGRGWIIEGVGNTYRLTPGSTAWHGCHSSLRCYMDDTLGFFKGPDPDTCDTTYYVSNVPELTNTRNEKPIISPSGSGLLIRSSNHLLKSIIIYDLLGRRIYQNLNLASREHLIPKLSKENSKSIYLVRITTNKSNYLIKYFF